MKVNINTALALASLLAMSALLFASAPVNGDFGWYESARNALTGAFVHDLILAHPFSDPVGWAERYYTQYPALVILFYPPLLHVTLGLAALIFGVSPFSSMLVMFGFYLILIFGVYALARRVFEPLAAAGVALAFCVSPAIATWARQIMHEIPMMAMVVWSLWYGLRYIDRDRAPDLYRMALFGLAALYIKQTAIIVILSYGLFLILIKGPGVLARRAVWVTMLLSALALLPLVFMQFSFASYNLLNLTAHPQGHLMSLSERAGWYLTHLPAALGWPVTVAAGLFVLGLLVRKYPREILRRDAGFLLLWFVVSYFFFTWISLKGTRHGIPMYLPVVFAAFGVLSLLPLGRWRGGIAFLAGVLISLQTLIGVPAVHDRGYAEAAAVIVREAPANAKVLFMGNKDGDFIYNIRANGTRSDISVVRVAKLLLDFRISPLRELNPRQLSVAELEQLLNDNGISYVVSDEQSFMQAEVIRNLLSLLHSEKFESVHTIDVQGVPQPFDGIKQLVIYRSLGELAPAPKSEPIRVVTGELLGKAEP